MKKSFNGGKFGPVILLTYLDSLLFYETFEEKYNAKCQERKIVVTKSHHSVQYKFHTDPSEVSLNNLTIQSDKAKHSEIFLTH